jgi:hypothetical protein
MTLFHKINHPEVSAANKTAQESNICFWKKYNNTININKL